MAKANFDQIREKFQMLSIYIQIGVGGIANMNEMLIWMLEWKRRTLQTKSLKYFLFCQLNYRTFLSRASPKELIDYSEFLHTDRFQERSCPKLIHRLRSIEKNINEHLKNLKSFNVKSFLLISYLWPIIFCDAFFRS